jgi:hypothetical protein
MNLAPSSSFGSISYSCRNIEPPPKRVTADTFDYDQLLGAVRDEWELAGVIGARLRMRGQHVGRRLATLCSRGLVIRAMVKTDIYWRLA